tara:strand:+ start:460 stop:819 length:360 start_codon:yes stop_codon:yes gene_type:complete
MGKPGRRCSLERETINDKAPGPDEVLIEVLYCGLCHSDLLRIDSERTADAPPAVSGHEVVGRIVAAGHQVDPKRIGNLVGLGFIAGTCRHCDFCLGGDRPSALTWRAPSSTVPAGLRVT